MASLLRLTVRNLLNTVLSFPPEIRNDPRVRSYTPALGVVNFLGENWLEEHIQPLSGATGFLQVDLDAETAKREVQYFRTIDLGELLFNLQQIEGFTVA